jgi:polyisoprenyl-phosphate glycosyltransferase
MLKQVAVVVPIYNEMACLPALLDAYRSLVHSEDNYHWQFIFVDDGSSDGSLAYLKLQKIDRANVLCVELSRNFGHQMAISAGLSIAKDADAVVMMDGDMQDPPALIQDMLRQFEQGFEVVLAKRTSRAERGWRRLGMWLFHKVMLRFSDFPLSPNTGIYSLMAQEVVAKFNGLSERNRYLPALRSWLGYKVAHVVFARDQRFAGEPKQSFKHLVEEAVNCMFSFSNFPIRFISYMGIVATVVGLLLALFFVVKRVFFNEIAVIGFTSLFSMIAFFGGVQLISLGVIGQYIARIHDQSMARPLYVIRKVHCSVELAAANSPSKALDGAMIDG